MILYFTGTGNSRYAASIVSRITGDELVSIHAEMRNRRENPYLARYSFSSRQPFVIVSPTHCYRLPRAVEEFLRDCRFVGSRKLYFLLTCGSSAGAAAVYARKLAEDMGMEYMGLGSVVMPENYIALFNSPSYDQAQGILRAAVSPVESYARLIAAEKTITDSSRGSALLSRINPLFYRFWVKDKLFRVGENCSGCGLCEKICPMVNIRMTEQDRPRWSGNCMHCMACISSCPQEAIEYGPISRGKRRYLLLADGQQKKN